MQSACEIFKIDFEDPKICRTCKLEKAKHKIPDSPLKKPQVKGKNKKKLFLNMKNSDKEEVV